MTQEEKREQTILQVADLLRYNERIKKAIIEHFECSHSSIYPYKGFTKKQILTWLEKQGEKGTNGKEREIPNSEQKPVKVPKFKVGDFIQFNGMGHTRYTIKDVCGLSHYINSCNKRMDMSYTDANFELVRQKPAWSEEDERMFNSALWHIKNSCGNGGKNSGEFEVYNWLKSLKERVQPQNTWKPSGAQIASLTIACDRNDRIGFDLTELLKGLKKYGGCSMLPQWKPSEEQIEALDNARHSNPFNVHVLDTLFHDLKKLREE